MRFFTALTDTNPRYDEPDRAGPYLARARGSNLLNYVLQSIEKSANGTNANAMVVISGHDTNISNLSGALGLSWLLPTYQRDDVPPGSALIFSLWQAPGSTSQYVRLQFVAQTLDQMHNATKLSRENPPAIANVFVTGCSTAQDGFPCEWTAFRKTIESAIDPAFVN